jgi:glycerol-3-phosphate dehydrogenase
LVVAIINIITFDNKIINAKVKLIKAFCRPVIFNPLNRNQFLEKATTIHFETCIIGGGATGAGCVLDAQNRGLQSILIEQEDFSAGTSSKSTKLIHGGVRYLEQAVKKLSIGQFKMVRKALKERKTLLSIASHITRPLQLITPCRNWVAGMYYFIGLKLYDWISGSTNIGSSRLLSKAQALKIIPTLKASQLFSAVLYYDGQLDDQRFNIALIQTAVEKGAVCINHCKAISFEKDVHGKLTGVNVSDKLTGQVFTIKAKQFINATGPFADAIRILANENVQPRIRVSKGVHILLPARLMPTASALLIPETRDGRLIFVIPYGHYLLAGTTDDEVQLTKKEFGPNADEVAYLLDYVNQYLDINATVADITAGFGGLRPLITAPEGDTKDLVRDHEVEVDKDSGLISILGGKWTTYRLMAKDTIDDAAERLGHMVSTVTTSTDGVVLVGSQHFNATTIREKVKILTQHDEDVVDHLINKYGDKALVIGAHMAQEPAAKKLLMEGLPYTFVELEYVVKNEMACTVKDVLNRRWGIQLFSWQHTLALIPIVGAWMTNYFNWDERQQQLYIHDYATEVKNMMEKMLHN